MQGDVSNKGPSQVDSKDGNKGAAAASEQAPRRSRRLAQDPAEDGNPAEEGELAATRSRASSKTRTDAKKKTGPVSKSRRRIAGTKRPGDTSKDLAPRPRKSSRRESTESTKSAPTDPPSERRRTRSQSLPRNLCSDILPHTDYGLIREPFDSSKYTPGLADHDAENTGDVLEVSNYVTDIYQRLYNAEVRQTWSIGNYFWVDLWLTLSFFPATSHFPDSFETPSLHEQATISEQYDAVNLG